MALPGWQDQTMAGHDGESATANAHAGWRLVLAERAVRAYAPRTEADISTFCEELLQRRRAVDPPSAERKSAAP
jgi:hypothetical protein